MDAKIILFDEPFAGLFPEIVKRVEAIILKLKSEGRTIVLVEHNMNIIRSLSDHVIVMDAGKLLAEGNPTETLDKREVIEAYLGE
jgi:branched-chain amino acid transport system ATP-binding protein